VPKVWRHWCGVRAPAKSFKDELRAA
jgi:hypothetical protein